MKSFVTLMLCLLSMTTFAQVHDEITSAMEEFDYDKVINLISPGTKDSLLLSTRIQALKAMNRYPEAIVDLTSLFVKDTTDTKILIDLAECYKLMGSPRQAADYYRKAVSLRPNNKFFRLQYIRSLLNAENFKEARDACHGWLEQDTVSATGYKYLGHGSRGRSCRGTYRGRVRRRCRNGDPVTLLQLVNCVHLTHKQNEAVEIVHKTDPLLLAILATKSTKCP